jgi:glycosyltransferase involved in cell wall biosynthesis
VLLSLLAQRLDRRSLCQSRKIRVATMTFSPRRKIVVLMSTYNGERFVSAQLDSILSQLPISGRVFVRDDGSQDRTVEIVASYRDPRVTVVRGENIGFGASFLTLLQLAPEDAEMTMFSDQDDVWLPGKIERAWDFLSPHAGMPAIYGSAQTLVDEHLNVLGVTPPWPRGPSLQGALAENIFTGCTSALNPEAVALLKQAGVPRNIFFHDWWCYLVLSTFGTVVYDSRSTLLYRQHGGNVIGHGVGWFGRQARMASFLLRTDWVGILLGQIHALLQCYGESMPSATRQWLLQHFHLHENEVVPSWRFIFAPRRYRQMASHELPLRILLTLHKLRLWRPRRRSF